MAERKFTMDTHLLFEIGQSSQIEVPCRVEFTYTPGAPESWTQPADPPECEVTGIEAQGESEAWWEVPHWIFDKLAADSELINQLCDYAAEAMADEKAEAMERRAEARRDE